MDFAGFCKMASRSMSGIAVGSCVLISSVSAEERAISDHQPAPVVVELFTSQACSSCVSATKYFNHLAKRGDVVALSWHVDYWNFLDTKKGRWIDPFSKPAFSQRQRNYNENIRKRSSIYTPQIIINGEQEAVGSSRDKIDELITEYDRPDVTIMAEAPAFYVTFTVGPSPQGGNAYLVTFKPETETDVRAGENTGVHFHNRNVVRRIEALGAVMKRGAKISVPLPQATMGCAILIQEPGQGRIIAARYCPK